MAKVPEMVPVIETGFGFLKNTTRVLEKSSVMKKKLFS